MGRSRRRPGAGALREPAASPARARSGPGRQDGRPWADRELRRAERRRILLLNLLPGRFQDLAARGGAGLLAVVVVHVLLVLAVGLLLLRASSGTWLPPHAGVTVLAVGVASQLACRAANGRARP